MSDFTDIPELEYYSDTLPDTMEDLMTEIQVLNTTAIQSLKVMNEWITTTDMYVSFKVPTIYENQNIVYNGSESKYRIPSMNFITKGLQQSNYKSRIIKSEFSHPFLQMRIITDTAPHYSYVISGLNDLTEPSVEYKLTYLNDMVRKNTDATIDSDLLVTPSKPFFNGAPFGLDGVLSKIKFDSLMIEQGSPIFMYGGRTISSGNSFDNIFLYNITKDNKRIISSDTLYTNDNNSALFTINGLKDINGSVNTNLGYKSYLIFGAIVTISNSDTFKYIVIPDDTYTVESDMFNAVIVKGTDFYDYVNSYEYITNTFLSKNSIGDDYEGVKAVGLIGGFHIGENRNIFNTNYPVNFIGKFSMEDAVYSITSGSESKSLQTKSIVDGYCVNIVSNSIWDIYNHPKSAPANMVKCGELWADIYPLRSIETSTIFYPLPIRDNTASLYSYSNNENFVIGCLNTNKNKHIPTLNELSIINRVPIKDFPLPSGENYRTSMFNTIFRGDKFLTTSDWFVNKGVMERHKTKVYIPSLDSVANDNNMIFKLVSL